MTPALNKETVHQVVRKDSYKYVWDTLKDGDKPIIVFEKVDKLGNPSHPVIAGKYHLGTPMFEGLPDLWVGGAGSLDRQNNGKLKFWGKSGYCRPRDEATTKQEVKRLAEEILREEVEID